MDLQTQPPPCQWWKDPSARWPFAGLVVLCCTLAIILIVSGQAHEVDLGDANTKVLELQRLTPPLSTWAFARPQRPFMQDGPTRSEANTKDALLSLLTPSAVREAHCEESDAGMQQCVINVSHTGITKLRQARDAEAAARAKEAELQKQKDSMGPFAQSMLQVPLPRPTERPRQEPKPAPPSRHVSFSGPSVPMSGGVQGGLTSENMTDRPEPGTPEYAAARQSYGGDARSPAASKKPITTGAHKRVLNERSDSIKKVETRTYGSPDDDFKWAKDA